MYKTLEHGSAHGRRRYGRRAAGTVGVLTAAVLAIGGLTAAPGHAAGTVTGLTVTAGSPGWSVGVTSQYGTNCTYTLTAAVSDYHPVAFRDSTGAATFYPSASLSPDFDVHTLKGQATVSWTPSGAGWHHLVAEQYPNGSTAIDVLVGNGINTGSACIVLP